MSTKRAIPACTWYLPVFQSLNAEKSRTIKRNHDTEPADFIKLFLNTYSAKPAQERSKTRSARSAGRSPFPWTPKRLPTTSQAAGEDFWCPSGIDEAVTPGWVCREPPAPRCSPRASEGSAAGAAGCPPADPVWREGGGLEPLDPRSGKPDARPGTDASSRAIFTVQWMRCRSRSRSWSRCSSAGAQPGSRGPARNSGTTHTAPGFVPTPPPRVSSPSESTEKSMKSLSAEKPESSALDDQSFLPW